MTLSFSRTLAVVVGGVTLLSEVARRRSDLLDLSAVLLWIDDALLGGFLLYGAWRVAADEQSGRPILAAAWGFTCGLAFYSFFEHLQLPGAINPTGRLPVWVMAVKGVVLVLGIVGMIAALRAPQSVTTARGGRNQGHH